MLRALCDELELDVEHVELGIDGLDRVQVAPVELIAIEAPLPDLDLVTLCAEIKLWTRAPIVIVDTHPAPDVEVAALDAGADDVVAVPYVPEVLATALRVALRRAITRDATPDDSTLLIGDVELDPTSHRIRIHGNVQDIQPRCAAILVLLARNRGRIVGYDQLSRAVWGGAANAARRDSLRTSVRLLRRILGSGHLRPVIETATGTGYRLIVPDDFDGRQHLASVARIGRTCAVMPQPRDGVFGLAIGILGTALITVTLFVLTSAVREAT